MSIAKPVARVLAPFIAVVLVLAAFAAVSVSTTSSSAEAAQAVKIKPKGPYKKNQTIKVTSKGFPPGATVAVGVCPHKIRATGATDCGAGNMGYSRLTSANAKGVVKTTVRVPKGKIFSGKYPKAKCSNKKKQKCSVHVATIGGPTIYKRSKILKYA